MQQSEYKKILVDRFIHNTATEDELEVFFSLLEKGELDEYLAEAMMKEEEKITHKNARPIRRIFTAISVAAASVLLVLATGYFLNDQKVTEETPLAENKATEIRNDVEPGTNKAILILADGSKVVLDETSTGILANQGGVQVIKADDGTLEYGSQNQGAGVVYNTITTPRGGQYKIILSDGTGVWLNAESSLRYPASFSGAEREVTLTGEGYFEVAHNTAKPFFVSDGSVRVQVLGTHFNMNSYDDAEEVRVTLLEGSVKVSALAETQSPVTISPGQQARVEYNRANRIQVRQVDVEKVVAWKNGYFSFENATITTIMKDLSRWYNIDVIYEGKAPKVSFSGAIGRELTLRQVLKVLEETRIHHTLIGKKLIIKN